MGLVFTKQRTVQALYNCAKNKKLDEDILVIQIQRGVENGYFTLEEVQPIKDILESPT